MFKSISAKEKWDLILFVEPVGQYVNDGYRDMTMADQRIRREFSDYLKSLCDTYLVEIDRVCLKEDYLGNYQTAKQAIDQIYLAD